MQTQLHIAKDVGRQQHRVAIGWKEGDPIEEFDCPHTAAGLSDVISRIHRHKESHQAEVSVAMEGFGGYAHPLDSQILAQGWRLYAITISNLPAEIFPAPAKTDAIGAKRMLQLM